MFIKDTHNLYQHWKTLYCKKQQKFSYVMCTRYHATKLSTRMCWRLKWVFSAINHAEKCRSLKFTTFYCFLFRCAFSCRDFYLITFYAIKNIVSQWILIFKGKVSSTLKYILSRFAFFSGVSKHQVPRGLKYFKY